MTRIFFICSLYLLFISKVHSTEIYTPGQKTNKTFKNFGVQFLDNHCLECHDNDTEKGNLSLEELGPVDETNAALWKSIWAQVALKQMPPKKKKQPKIVERLLFSDWVVEELINATKNKGGFKAHLDPKKANYLDHDLLFGLLPKNIKLSPTFTPARIWRVTREEHITRLNELINTEAKYDPKKPGIRTRGDVVPTNHGGELKLYFGTDRISSWQGGTVAYATAVKSVPAILSPARSHGLKNYPDFYSVNSSESTQILGKASDIIKYMAYGPLSLVAFPEQITDGGPGSYKFKGDIRGQPSAIIYNTKVVRPLTPVYELLKESELSDSKISKAVDYLFEALTFRPPNKTESDQYLKLTKQSIDKLGTKDGTVMGLSAIFLDRDALFRSELAEEGNPDAYGRVMLKDWELGLAINHALCYIQPDAPLKKSIVEGRMRSKEDVQREVKRILEDESIRKPRILQFFRDFFDYDHAGYICKDDKALAATGIGKKGASHYKSMFRETSSTDRLIELILKEDKNVLKRLLTTNQVVVTKINARYFGRMNTQEEIKQANEVYKKQHQQKIKKDEAEITKLKEWIAKLVKEQKEKPKNKKFKKTLESKQKTLEKKKKALANNKKRRNNPNPKVKVPTLEGPQIYSRVSRRSFGKGSMKPERILSKVSTEQRLGLLTHPSWLVSHSDAMDNHAIHRGIWVRTKLLGGGIPDVPITVDAMLPDEPKSTLRHRMRVTREKYCWTCHQKMDPLGLPFERYNHAGVYRYQELGKPVDTSGEIIDSGDEKLDGKVTDAIDMIKKISESERTDQVFVRYAFRFWMGRNETLNDRPVIQAAYKAYKENNGSMNALLLSLLTSDAFVYRKKGAENL